MPTAISRQLNPECMGRDFCSGPRWLQLGFFHQGLALPRVILGNSEGQRLFWGQVLHLGCAELICRETCCEIPTLAEGMTSHELDLGAGVCSCRGAGDLCPCGGLLAQGAWQLCAKGLCFVAAIQQCGTSC